MKEFPISFEICLGYHCCGCGEYIDATGTVLLEDEQVSRLVSFLQQSDGETDIVAIGLEEKHPDIYSVLEEAYSDAAGTAVYRHWLLEGYTCGYFNEPEGLMEDMEADGLFKYEANSEVEDEMGGDEVEEDITDDEETDYAKERAFDEWKDEYFDSLDEDDKVAFIEKYYGDNLVNEDVSDDGEYDIEIPEEILMMAKGEDA